MQLNYVAKSWPRESETMTQDANQPDGRRKDSKWKGYLQFAVILGAVAVAFYFARAPEQVERVDSTQLANPERKPVARVIQPESTEQALTLELTGTVSLKERVTVLSEVVGRVVWVSPKFEPGGSLEADEVFIRVDPSEFELRVEKTRLKVDALEYELQIQQAGSSDARKIELDLRGAQLELKLAELQLEKTRISLPYNFRVISSSVEVGELVGTVETVGRAAVLGMVYRPESIRVHVPIDQQDLLNLQPVEGRTAEIRTRLNTYRGTIATTSSIVDSDTRMASLYLKFSDDGPLDSLPLPNTFAEIAITGPSHAGTYVLPEAASQAFGQVWLVRDGILESFEPLTLGRTDDHWIVESFDAGDGVVVGAIRNAQSGLAVTVTDFGS